MAGSFRAQNFQKSKKFHQLQIKWFNFKPLTPTHPGEAEGRRDGGTERGKEGRRMGTRAKPGNQLVYHICIHLLNPHWTMPRQAVISTQQHKLAH